MVAPFIDFIPNRDHSEAQLHESHTLIVLLTPYSMFPDPTSRQPSTAAAFLPLYTCHYALAVLAILPHTFIPKLALLPIVLWQAWNCAVGLDLSAGVANSLGLESPGRVRHLNFAFVVRFLFAYSPHCFFACFLLAC